MNSEAISIVKRSGITGLAKRISESGNSFGLTEHDLVDLVTSHALCEHSGRISGARAFAKVYTAPTQEGALLRQAHAVIRDAQFADSDYPTVYPYPK